MAAINVNTNLAQVMNNIASAIGRLKDRNYLLRPIAIETIANMKERIHRKGQGSDGAQIGTYSNSYMRQRAEANRGPDRKIIVALTSQLEQDWSVIPTDKGYAIGFNNAFNAQKLRWVEQNKNKQIGNLTDKEKQYISERLNELTADAFNS